MSLFSKHARNQRISSTRQRKQQHLLEVKLRVGKERERRLRWAAGLIFKTVVIVGVLAGMWIGGKEGLRRYLWENPELLVREPRVTTDGTLTIEQVLTATDLLEPRNIFTIDLGTVRTALEKLPQVESAEVQRTLPNQLAINITERRPIAWVTQKKDEDPTTSERSFLIDARSIVLRSRVLQPEYYHLPVISGVETENLQAGQRVTLFDVQAALELVRLNADNNRFQARNIDLSKGYGLVVTDQRRAKITFAFANIEGQLGRLYQVLDEIEPTHREIQSINLIPVRNVPVVFRNPNVEIETSEVPVEAVEKAPVKPEEKDSKGKLPPPRTNAPSPKGPSKRLPEPATKPEKSPTKARSAAPSPTPKPSPVDHLKKRFDLNG